MARCSTHGGSEILAGVQATEIEWCLVRRPIHFMVNPKEHDEKGMSKSSASG